MTPAERRRVTRVLREAARIVAEGDRLWLVYYSGACSAIVKTHIPGAFDARDAFDYAMNAERIGRYFWPLNEEHRSVRVIALLLTAEAVLTGDCDD